MKSLKLKYLTPICFLIFFMPFLRMCDGKVETIETNTEDVSQVISLPAEEVNHVNTVATEDVNLNTYQLGGVFFKLLLEGELDAKIFAEIDFWESLCYSLILLNSILMVILSFLSKFHLVKNLAIVNVILLIISTILFIKSGFIENFSDVKYGFYVFLIYSFLIIYFAKKEFLELKTL
ncbi:hypothetical protein Q73A0000_16070 [Kaistella flava (ex Peng et al. 2021)]|uniref:Uncharacterized protein n=1 Tax=Kaistella flava (ex Peng et al. 2021) TaxID=2038776 RepID=A0A7M2YD83_9FLAO|nr:hypothetical protein [Kaistella flava (ex Peng et al. 2021)]QOW11769.1 hypothetical protein Q73A0000_16070 [Kaistella flava (ex Peng et al. 2021)]